MGGKNLTKQELDELGRKLLAAGRATVEEIERAAAAPHLPAAIRAGIEAERNRRKAAQYPAAVTKRPRSSGRKWCWRAGF